VLYYHGIRASEVAKLNLRDLKEGDPPRIHVVESKGHKSRVLITTEKSLACLKPWLIVREELARKETPAMFLSAKGGRPLTAPGVRWIVKQYLRQAGLYRSGIGPHALRHAHASHAIAAGADINALAAELGHASIQTTTVYCHVVNAISQNPAEFLE
jgi:integrase/recombinase XerC